MPCFEKLALGPGARGAAVQKACEERYGKKLEAVALLQKWVQTIGTEAGLTPENTAINSGSVGSPESRLELEVEFDTLADLERFWSSIPQGSHQKWSQSIQPLIVDGSPAWEIFRTIETFSSKVSSDNESKARGSLEMASGDEVQKFGAGAAPSLPTGTQTTASGLSVVENSDDADIVLDWKGEPMKINPGDKLPFKF